MYNHDARKKKQPSEYRPFPRISTKISSELDRKGYWCHPCCCTRLDSKGMDFHYEQAHPSKARDASSQLCTSYANSRHGRPRKQHAVEHHSPMQAVSAGHDRGIGRPRAQLRPVRCVLPTIADELPFVRQPSPPQSMLPRYQTASKKATMVVKLRGIRSIPSEVSEVPSSKRQRISKQTRRSAKYWGDILDEESDSEQGPIPHDASSQETWKGIMDATEEVNNDLSADAISALDAGAPYIGEAQARSFFPINTAAPSEVSSYDGYLSALDMLVRRMFQKQADLRDLMIELTELMMAEGSPVA